WAILLRQKQKKLIMLPSETMIWQPEFTDKTLSRKPGAVQIYFGAAHLLPFTEEDSGEPYDPDCWRGKVQNWYEV
ncbi:hypothetical protein ACP80Y_22850, partial [Escherichia coli]